MKYLKSCLPKGNLLDVLQFYQNIIFYFFHSNEKIEKIFTFEKILTF